MNRNYRRSEQQKCLSGALGCFWVASTALLCLLQVAECQFLQPQSHLGRLVQSITSPLVLSSAYGSSEGDDSDAPEQARPQQPEMGGAQHFQHYQPQASQRARHQAHQMRPSQEQAAGLQGAPSQERAVPQHFYEGGNAAAGPQGDDDDNMGHAPSSPHKQRSGAANEYQMGAYLGPTIDDKDIQGAFNSKDDERDEDGDSAAGYMGPPGGEGRQRGMGAGAGAFDSGSPYAAAAAGATGYSSTGYPMSNNGGGQPNAASPSSYDDDSSADEDDEPPAARGRDSGRRFKSSGLNQAASQYHQRRPQQQAGHRGGEQQQQQQMQAAANGYAPYGFPAGNGPIDLSSLMAAAAGGGGGGPAGGYEVYNGDGSYPGANYYQQQGQGQGRRNQAASNAGPYGPYGQQPRPQGDNDEQEADGDDD